MGNDLLSTRPDSKPFGQVFVGYVVKSTSPMGVSFVENTRSKNYIKYIITNYRSGWNEFSRTEYFLPNDKLVYVHDCDKGHGYCNKQKFDAITAIFKETFGKEYLTRKKSSKSKPKVKKGRVTFLQHQTTMIKGKIKCGCK